MNNLSDKILINKGIFTNKELASLNTKINSSLMQIRNEFGKNSGSPCSTCTYSKLQKSAKLEKVINFARKMSFLTINT